MTISSVWLIRCGEGGSAVEACVSNDVVAVRFPAVGDVASLQPDEVVAQMSEMPDRNDVQRLASELLVFANDIKPGDLVLTPEKERKRFVLGTVTGDYRWDEETPIAELQHLRSVDWNSYLDWDAVPMDFKSIKYYQRVVLRVENSELLDACEEAMETTISKEDLLAASKTSAKLKSRKTPTVKPVKSTAVPQEKRCAACGLKKHTAQFAGTSDLCVDCA